MNDKTHKEQLVNLAPFNSSEQGPILTVGYHNKTNQGQRIKPVPMLKFSKAGTVDLKALKRLIADWEAKVLY